MITWKYPEIFMIGKQSIIQWIFLRIFFKVAEANIENFIII